MITNIIANTELQKLAKVQELLTKILPIEKELSDLGFKLTIDLEIKGETFKEKLDRRMKEAQEEQEKRRNGAI